jgi:hypothetical protein
VYEADESLAKPDDGIARCCQRCVERGVNGIGIELYGRPEASIFRIPAKFLEAESTVWTTE